MQVSRVWIVIVLGALISACSASGPGPEIVASGSDVGGGYPRGTSESAPFDAAAGYATSPTYGYSPEEPVLVATGDSGPESSRRYLSSLRGPNGEVVSFERKGSCCGFETPSSPLGVALLDIYELTYPGLAEPLVLYINMYDSGEKYIPHGLTSRE